jgi:hypothetical protein
MVLTTFLSLVFAGPFAQSSDFDADYKRQIGTFLDQWHDDAAHSRASYFDKIAMDGIYIGTDKTERWTREEFQEWAKKYISPRPPRGPSSRSVDISMFLMTRNLFGSMSSSIPGWVCARHPESSGIHYEASKFSTINYPWQYPMSLSIKSMI